MRIRLKQAGRAALALVALGLGATGLDAQTNIWLNPAAGKWETGTNWSLGGPPSPLEFVFITDTNVAGTVALIDGATSTNHPGTLTISNLTISGNSVLSLDDAGTNVPLHVLRDLKLGGGGSLTESGSAVRVDGLMSLTGGTVAVTDGGTLDVANGTLGLGNDGTTTNGAGTSVMTITNATINALTLNLGSTAGGVGLLTLGTNAVVNVASNLTVVSGSLVATSSVTISGGTFRATNGVTQIGSAGSAVLTVLGGNHTFRRMNLGSTNGLGTGTFHLVGGHVTVLGNGAGPEQGLSANQIWWEGGELDGSGTSLTIGAHHDAMVWIPGLEGSVLGQLKSMYVGYSPDYVGTYLQTDPTSTIIISDQLIVGDCDNGAVGSLTLSPGGLYVTNETQTANLEVRNGTFTLGPGATLVVDNLIMVDPCGRFLKQAGATLIANNPLDLGPDLDADGDGQSNAAELAAGTDPLDPTSLFKITDVMVENQDIRVTWTTVAGHSYVVQSSGSVGGPFLDASPVIPATDPGEGVADYVDVNGAAAGTRFYRVRLAP